MHPETIKKLNIEIREKLIAALGKASLQETVAQTRAASAEDAGSFEVVISTADVDRSGEIVDQAGWDLTFYKLNPIVLWGHDYYAPPIGVCDEIGVIDGKLIAKGRFAPEAANPFAQQIRRLYDAGMMRTTSVGFIAQEMEGNTITKSQLLEFSFVSVPANPMALSLRQMKELGLDSMGLTTKGIKLDIKAEPAEGDACTLEDGTAGTLDASLVCIATEPTPAAKAEGDVCTMDDGTEGVMQMQGETMVCVVKAATPAEGDVCTLEDGTEGIVDATGTCIAKEPAAETEPAAPTEAAKGLIADELATDEEAETKWEKLDDVFELINAFVDVYLDETTPADQFPTLLTELADLIGQLAAGTLPDADEEPASTTEASLNTGSVKSHRATAREILSRSAVEIMRTNTATQKDGASAKKAKRAVGEETPSGVALKQRSTNSSSDNAIEALKAWNTDRAAMREIATILSDALGKSAEKFRNVRNASSK